jgi:hypothetical protein
LCVSIPQTVISLHSSSFKSWPYSSLLATELSSINEASTTTSGVAQDSIARGASNDSLSVAEDDGNVVAGLAFDVHEEGVGGLDEALLLVLGLFGSKGRVQQISNKLHNLKKKDKKFVCFIIEFWKNEKKSTNKWMD